MKAELFVDGESEGAGTTVLLDNQHPEFLTEPVRIGGGISGRYSNARIGEVRIYNRALSASEVESAFNQDRDLFGV